jgi:hypothetical protein
VRESSDNHPMARRNHPTSQAHVKLRKKLIEVALPLEAINVARAREKSIRHRHPSAPDGSLPPTSPWCEVGAAQTACSISR